MIFFRFYYLLADYDYIKCNNLSESADKPHIYSFLVIPTHQTFFYGIAIKIGTDEGVPHIYQLCV